MVRTDAGEWRSLVSTIGHERLEQHLGPVANKIADREIPDELRAVAQESLLGLLSERTSLSLPTVGDLIRNVCESCDLGISSLLRPAGAEADPREGLRAMVAQRVKRITVKPFMDMNTMIEERLIQCCTHVGTRSADGLDQGAPFCAVQAWAPPGRTKLAEMAGRQQDQIPLTLRPRQRDVEVMR